MSLDTAYVNFTLIVGGYLFTAWVFRYLNKKIEETLYNHLKAIEKRLTKLEKG